MCYPVTLQEYWDHLVSQYITHKYTIPMFSHSMRKPTCNQAHLISCIRFRFWWQHRSYSEMFFLEALRKDGDPHRGGFPYLQVYDSFTQAFISGYKHFAPSCDDTNPTPCTTFTVRKPPGSAVGWPDIMSRYTWCEYRCLCVTLLPRPPAALSASHVQT